MDIELRLLRSFVAIHEAGSVSRAADRMACTQAAMSMRLKLIETEIGAHLFPGSPGGLQPTPRGAELYASALGVLSAYDEMLSLTRSRPPRDQLRLGMPDDIASGWLSGLIADLGPAFDRLEIELVCDLSANLMAALERREIDLALVTTAAAGTGPTDLVERATVPGLPALPPVPLHLVLAEDATAWARRAATALSDRLLARASA